MPLIVKGEVTVYPGAVITYEEPVHFATGIIIMSPIRIGAFSYFGERTILGSADSIGRFCSIAPGVSIGLGKHPTHYLSTSPIFFRAAGFFEHPGLPDIGTPRTPEFISHGPRIGHDVWIGANAIIGRGVTIGTGAIVAAGAFVRDDVRPYAIVGGTPAREIGQRFEDDTIARLLRTEWWDYDLSVFEGVDVTDVPGQIGRIEERIAARGKIAYDLWEAGGEAA